MINKTVKAVVYLKRQITADDADNLVELLQIARDDGETWFGGHDRKR